MLNSPMLSIFQHFHAIPLRSPLSPSGSSPDGEPRRSAALLNSLPHAGKACMVVALPPLFSPFRMTIRESSSWRVGESFGKHTKSAPLGRGALFMCCGIVDYLIMISSAFPVDYFPVSLSALPVDVPKEE